jgi:hypothetical protein
LVGGGGDEEDEEEEAAEAEEEEEEEDVDVAVLRLWMKVLMIPRRYRGKLF